MKKNLALLLAALALAVRADTTPTNAVKLSALPGGITPLSGAEYVPIIQSATGTGLGSSNQTKIVTLNSLLNAATTAANNAQTSANTASNANTLTSNLLSAAVGNLNTVSNNFGSFSNSTAAILNLRGGLFPSNSILIANVADAGTMARRSTNDFYLAANPSGYQTQVQVTNAINSALAAAGLAQSGTVVSFSSVTAPVNLTPSLDNGGGYTLASGQTTNILVNLAANNFQTIELNPGSGGSATYNFIFTNAADGQNVWLVAAATNSGVAWKYSAGSPTTGGTLDSWNGSGATSGTVGSGQKAALLNWQVFGTRIIFTSTVHP